MGTSTAFGPGSTVGMPDGEMAIGHEIQGRFHEIQADFMNLTFRGLKFRQKCTRFSVYT